jgi:hypothetical protein
MKMQHEDQSFKTSDFCLAAYLLTKTIPLTGTTRDDSNRVTFVYQNSAELSSLIISYFQMKAVIEPMAFFSAQKRLKQLIYQR